MRLEQRGRRNRRQGEREKGKSDFYEESHRDGTCTCMWNKGCVSVCIYVHVHVYRRATHFLLCANYTNILLQAPWRDQLLLFGSTFYSALGLDTLILQYESIIQLLLSDLATLPYVSTQQKILAKTLVGSCKIL